MRNYSKHDVNVECLMKACNAASSGRPCSLDRVFRYTGDENEAARSEVKGNLTSINHYRVNFDRHKSR